MNTSTLTVVSSPAKHRTSWRLTATQTTYYIAHSDDGKTVHHGNIDAKHELATGQDEVHVFGDKAEWIEALAKLGVKPEVLE